MQLTILILWNCLICNMGYPKLNIGPFINENEMNKAMMENEKIMNKVVYKNPHDDEETIEFDFDLLKFDNDGKLIDNDLE